MNVLIKLMLMVMKNLKENFKIKLVL